MLIRIATVSDLPAIHCFLSSLALSSQGIDSNIQNFALGCEGSTLVCMGGYEQYGATALIRSVAVAEQSRGQGYATRICDFIESHARQKGVTRFYLLTETARDFFIHRGFVLASRTSAPEEIRTTEQFTALCPATADLLCRIYHN